MFREAQLVTKYPKLVVLVSVLIALGLGLFIPRIKIDTDPENMLAKDNPVRVFHHEVKEHFGLNDLLVLGIIRESGVYQKDTLERANRITERILTIDGVIAEDVMSFLTTDNVESGGGMLNVHRIADEVPEDPGEIENIRRSVNSNKFLADKLASRDGKGLAIYIPIVEKSESYRIANEIEEIIAQERGDGSEQYHLAGLPIAEDTFGYEMFKQMAISAPLAGLFIFFMMWLFFRRISLIISPMIVAGFSVVSTMGLLIGMGYTVHIMSSMIPIFLMPIAVVDSVHILSVFHDWYPKYRDKQKTISAVIKELFTPMLYTSITSAVGFASLALTPIPPVRVFGLFVAFGILLAWVLTVTFIPAYVMLLDDKRLGRKFQTHTESQTTLLGKTLSWMGRISTVHFKAVLVVGGVLIALSAWGITRIVINDNPVKWFKSGAKIRVADTVMNEHFAGTYMAYLVISADMAEGMKNPQTARWVSGLQESLEKLPVVGITSSYADIIRRVNWVIHDEDNVYDVIPQSREELAQYLFLFQMSGNPRDLERMVDYNYQKANIWVQMKRGDNRDMEGVLEHVSNYVKAHPAPDGISYDWAGLTYINVVWQEKMVRGMLSSLAGAYVAVLVLMIFLFRSVVWGILSMIPLSVTISLIYGIIGAVGKPYDMPVAVLSSLTLGLSVDFAIHFIQRYREIRSEVQTRQEAILRMFDEPARAIMRNVLVVAFGFTPLLFATLVPYITVGVFLASIMLISGIGTLMFLPALIQLLVKDRHNAGVN